MRSDVLTAREAALLLEIEFQHHGVTLSGWDAMNDAQHCRRGTMPLPVAKLGKLRYFRKADVETLAREIIGRGTKPPRPRPKVEELTFGIHCTDPAAYVELI